jgi:hypothetical protein
MLIVHEVEEFATTYDQSSDVAMLIIKIKGQTDPLAMAMNGSLANQIGSSLASSQTHSSAQDRDLLS